MLVEHVMGNYYARLIILATITTEKRILVFYSTLNSDKVKGA